jgi:hypothetical protein
MSIVYNEQDAYKVQSKLLRSKARSRRGKNHAALVEMRPVPSFCWFHELANIDVV